MKNKYPVCPVCGNEEKFQIEKSPYGDTKCLECSYKASHEYFSVQEDDGNEVIIIGVMRFHHLVNIMIQRNLNFHMRWMKKNLNCAGTVL